MNKAKISIISLIIFSHVFVLAGRDEYIVTNGDTLSGILRKKYPKENLYGQDGKITEVLKKNSEIKNANVIFPEQVIIFSEEEIAEIAKSNDEKPIQSQVENQVEEEGPAPIATHSIYGLLGLKITSLDQVGLLGTAKIGELSFPVGRFGYDMKKGKWLMFASAEILPFSISGQSQNLTGIEVGGGYKNFVGALSLRELAIYEVSASSQQTLHKQNLTSALIGYEYQKKIEQYSVMLTLRGGILVPLKQNIDVSGVSSSSPSGFGAKVLATADYGMFTWQNELAYWDVSNSTARNSISASTDINTTEFTSAFGLKYNF